MDITSKYIMCGGEYIEIIGCDRYGNVPKLFEGEIHFYI